MAEYGIKHEDVYETSDLPEVDQSQGIYEPESTFIERLHINTAETINFFKNKELDSSAVDFSDSINKRIRTSGYKVSTCEIAGSGEEETPVAKLNRIKLELEHLQEELSSDSSSHQGESSDIPETLSTVKSEAALLLKKITEFSLDGVVDSDYSSLEPTSIQLTTLQNKFQKLVEETNEQDDDGVEKTTDNFAIEESTPTVKYRLKIKPNQSSLSYAANISKLENRLNKLESLIGSGNPELARLFNICGDENGMLDYVQWMVTKLSLLDTNQLDTIECRVGAVNTRLDQLAEKTGLNVSDQDPEKDKKIDELYDLSIKAKEFSELIPSLLERMTCLDSLHREGKRHIESLNQLELLQNEMTNKVTNNESLLRNLEDELKSNISAVNKSIESVQMRVNALVASGATSTR